MTVALSSGSAFVRAEALRTAGALGRDDVVSMFSATREDDRVCRFWAAWAAVLLGNRSATDTLANEVATVGPEHARAFTLALQALPVDASHSMLESMARNPKHVASLIQGSGVVGDPTYIPWLIGLMSDDGTARLAGEAFSLITGADLALLDLERKPPETLESVPNDDPNDSGVDMDSDDGLPWPDVKKIETWWTANSGRFQKGTRYFFGKAVTREHCIDVLKNGYQRQRILAAHYLCLLEPGTPLFNTSAPAWRQQKQLAQMK